MTSRGHKAGATRPGSFGSDMRARLGCSVALFSLAAGCVSVDKAPPAAAQPLDAPPTPINQTSDQVAPIRFAGEPDARAEKLVHKGSGRTVSAPGKGARSGRGSITVNLVEVEAEDAIQQILGDILSANYVIEQPVEGMITIQTSYPVDQRTLLRLLSSALASRGAALINEGGFYRITSAEGAAGTSGAVGFGPSLGDLKVGPGVQVVPLQYVSATEMEKILKPLAADGAIARVDVNRNILILKEDSRNIEAMLELVDMFDVDWMSGMSFALVPVKNSSAIDIVKELEAVFSIGGEAASTGVVRFVPLERLNSVLAITSQPGYLDQVADWMDRLDRYGHQADQGFYVVPVQNRPATEIADLLQRTLSSTGAAPLPASGFGVAPGLEAVVTASTPSATGGEITVPVEPGAAPALQAADARIYADDANNALVILASSDQYRSLEQVIQKLDTTPNQVLLEATIAEVTLRDDLSYGVTWFLESGEFNFTFSDVATGAVAESFPGFSMLFSGDDGRAALSAVASVTDVKVLSSPSLMVLDNRTATLQVGDQVPIVTQSAVSTNDPDAPIVNSVELRDTGVILKVTPRVNEGGRVMLDIEQEVSDVVETSTSGIDSPTIQQRKISTSVAVDSGSTIALGGLIRDRVSDVESKVPLLGDIPGFGELFKSTTKKTERTELIVLITPRVVSGSDSARQVTDELRLRMRSVGAAMDAAAVRAAKAPGG